MLHDPTYFQGNSISVLCSSYQKTTSLIGGITGNITNKLGQMRHSESFRSIEEKVESAYENVKVSYMLGCIVFSHSALRFYYTCAHFRRKLYHVLILSKAWMKTCALAPAPWQPAPPSLRRSLWLRGSMLHSCPAADAFTGFELCDANAGLVSF